MNELALFAGAGGEQLASQWLKGWRTVCYVEREPYAVAVLRARITDGLLDDAPIWDDARTFDGNPWRGRVDIITGGAPCQPTSAAGAHAWIGWNDPRNMFPDTFRIIREVRPAWVFLENSPELLISINGEPPYIATITRELAESGYVGQWGCLSAASVGADHIRERIWIAAHADSVGHEQPKGAEKVDRNQKRDISTHRKRRCAEFHEIIAGREAARRRGEWPGAPSKLCGMDDEVAHRVDRLKAIGNGQVPAVAAAAWRLLTE